MKIDEFCDKLETLLNAKPAGSERLEVAAEALRQAFKLQPDEVALLAVDRESEVLRFLWPTKLQQSGFVPLSSRDSLAARTLRENKAFVNNRFASTFHASIFEHVKLDPKSDSKPQPIHKIISVPLLTEGEPKGVVQLSRKGVEAGQAGDDFSKDDLTALVEMAKVIARNI